MTSEETLILTKFFLNLEAFLMFDAFFISYDEPNADQNYSKLNIPCQRIHGVKGILNAHKQAAERANTEMFWVIDGDNEVVSDFNFDFTPVWDDERRFAYVWKSKNPLNELIYGNGGVKLLSVESVLNTDSMQTDMTTSFKNFTPMNVIASITRFNSSPFNTWRSAFRECVKLSSNTVKSIHNENRLETWCTKAEGDYADWCLLGANQGKKYGIEHKNDPLSLSLINDFDWLYKQYLKKLNN